VVQSKRLEGNKNTMTQRLLEPREEYILTGNKEIKFISEKMS
jgi:hypothetical protein